MMSPRHLLRVLAQTSVGSSQPSPLTTLPIARDIRQFVGQDSKSQHEILSVPHQLVAGCAPPESIEVSPVSVAFSVRPVHRPRAL